jgi:hypothetical protein
MADTTEQQQQYPNLNPYSGSNGQNAGEQAKGAANSVMSSEVSTQLDQSNAAAGTCCLLQELSRTAVSLLVHAAWYAVTVKHNM